MGELFSKKAFHMEQTFLGKLMGGGSTRGRLMIALFKGRGSFKNAFFGNLSTINLKEVSNVVSCSVSFMLTLAWGIDILFERLLPEIGGWIWKTPFAHSPSRGWRFHAKPVFFFNIFCGDLHFDALIIGLC